MIIPKHLEAHFKIIDENHKQNYTVSGMLMCCGFTKFKIQYVGNLKQTILGQLYLQENEDRLILYAKCRQCGKILPIFNNLTDGYDNCINERNVIKKENKQRLQSFDCPKCHNNIYGVKIVIEYLGKKELKELDIQDWGNSFTWIWVSLKCERCGKVYKKILDLEMG